MHFTLVKFAYYKPPGQPRDIPSARSPSLPPQRGGNSEAWKTVIHRGGLRSTGASMETRMDKRKFRNCIKLNGTRNRIGRFERRIRSEQETRVACKHESLSCRSLSFSLCPHKLTRATVSLFLGEISTIASETDFLSDLRVPKRQD